MSTLNSAPCSLNANENKGKGKCRHSEETGGKNPTERGRESKTLQRQKGLHKVLALRYIGAINPPLNVLLAPLLRSVAMTLSDLRLEMLVNTANFNKAA